ncbi:MULTISPECIES: hypothetical protein [unclassified Ruminococcus]|uniref:hypothetical protein n=1 Tax=unclassified Ruminococcus TaxID=2608920 RepID=UPI00210BB3E6|nr:MULTISPECIES: hypothetical protein [unclassified Ruminococcus]MCQ4022415.1 hypothetical protein [Ruminococcus sp. zg-924]MCQ4114743.1 hypothetical protein [Ruminococcus sp. zg-921]
MQNKEISDFVLLPVPLDDLIASGIDLDGVIQTSAGDGRIIIENVADMADFICDGDCESCPMSEIDCDGDCGNCPCFADCDEAEVFGCE